MQLIKKKPLKPLFTREQLEILIRAMENDVRALIKLKCGKDGGKYAADTDAAIRMLQILIEMGAEFK